MVWGVLIPSGVLYQQFATRYTTFLGNRLSCKWTKGSKIFVEHAHYGTTDAFHLRLGLPRAHFVWCVNPDSPWGHFMQEHDSKLGNLCNDRPVWALAFWFLSNLLKMSSYWSSVGSFTRRSSSVRSDMTTPMKSSFSQARSNSIYGEEIALRSKTNSR